MECKFNSLQKLRGEPHKSVRYIYVMPSIEKMINNVPNNKQTKFIQQTLKRHELHVTSLLNIAALFLDVMVVVILHVS